MLPSSPRSAPRRGTGGPASVRSCAAWQKKDGRRHLINQPGLLQYRRVQMGDKRMPVYEFTCKGCKKTFTLTISLAQYEKAKFTCPKCKGKKVEQRFAPFFAVTSKKS